MLNATHDFDVVNHGSLVQISPLTERAKEWIEGNVQEGPTLGSSILVDHCCWAPIVEGMLMDGMTCAQFDLEESA